jgi:hypothetical protein
MRKGDCGKLIEILEAGLPPARPKNAKSKLAVSEKSNFAPKVAFPAMN